MLIDLSFLFLKLLKNIFTNIVYRENNETEKVHKKVYDLQNYHVFTYHICLSVLDDKQLLYSS